MGKGAEQGIHMRTIETLKRLGNSVNVRELNSTSPICELVESGTGFPKFFTGQAGSTSKCDENPKLLKSLFGNWRH